MTVSPSLAEVIALSELATAGPWLAMRGSESTGREVADWAITVDDASTWVCTGPTWDSEYQEESYSNGQFIAALVNWFRTSAAPLRDEDARDAARYRFLRSPESQDHRHHTRRSFHVGQSDWVHNLEPDKKMGVANMWCDTELNGDELDAAIDAATQPAAQERQA